MSDIYNIRLNLWALCWPAMSPNVDGSGADNDNDDGDDYDDGSFGGDGGDGGDYDEYNNIAAYDDQ